MLVTHKELIAAYKGAVTDKQRLDEYMRQELDPMYAAEYDAAQEIEWRTEIERTRRIIMLWVGISLGVSALCFGWLCYMGIPQLWWEAWTR